jgi:RNA polymerase sigma factor (TIGR02999 family)
MQTDRLDGAVEGVPPVTVLLRRIRAGEPGAREELFRVLYDELHGRARVAMRSQRGVGTLQPTALVHEAYLRMCGGSWNDRKHFLLAASQAMKHVMIDATRQHRAGHLVGDVIDQVALQYEDRAYDSEALHVALERLKHVDPDMERAVVLRFYGGVEEGEIARILGIPLRTYQRRWEQVRRKLFREIEEIR